MILKVLFIPYGSRDYVFKIILNSEGTLNRKRDYGLKNTLNSEGTKKGDEEKTRQQKSRKGEETKSFRQLNETLWCDF